MNTFYQILLGVALVGSGLLFAIYPKQIVMITGEFVWTNRYFGFGGTYTFFRVLGVFLIFLGFLFTFGYMRFMF